MNEQYIDFAKMVGRKFQIEDGEAEALLALSKIPREIEFKTYIRIAVKTHLIDILRLKKARKRIVKNIQKVDYTDPEVSDLKEILLKGLNQLPLHYKNVLIDHFYNHLTITEIAEKYNYNYEVTCKYKQRALQKLKGYLPCQESLFT